MRTWKVWVAVLGCLLLAISYMQPVAAASNFEAVYSNPKIVLVDQTVTVYVKFTDTSKIKSVTMHFCKIKPDLICFMPVDMASAGSNWYKGTTDTMKKYGIAAGSTAGYNISVAYTDSTTGEIPHVPNEFTNLTVEEPVAGSHYFSVPIVDQLPSSNVLSAYHTPEKLDYEKSITAYIRLNNVTLIKEVKLKLCQVEPTFKCFYPTLAMSAAGSGWYKVTTGTMKSYGITGAGKGGYNITVNYTDGTSDSVPHKPNEFSNRTVVDAQGASFFTFTIESPPPPNNGIPFIETVPIIAVVVASAVIAAILLSRRRKDA